MRTRGLLSSCAMALVALSTGAAAQNPPDQPSLSPENASPAARAEPAGLEDIVVTANRRLSNLQSTPIAVTALGSSELKANRVLDVRDIARSVPSLFVGGETAFGTTTVAIRGIGSLNTGIGVDEGVAIYVDGVYQATPFASFFSFVDVDQVEALRGPQGTLYGRNATGGAILINTVKPSAKTIFRADATVTNLNGLAGRAFLSGELVKDKLFASIAFGVNTRKSYAHNATPGLESQRFNNLDNNLFSASLRWTPSDDWDITTRVFRGRNNGTLAPKNYNDGIKSVDAIAAVLPNYQTYDYRGASLNTTGDLGFAQLALVSGYSTAKVNALIDSGVPQTIQILTNEKARSWYNEARLSSLGTGPFSWIIGASALDSHSQGSLDFVLLHALFGGPLSISFHSKLKTTSYSGFVEGTYKLTPELSVTGGVRYTKEKKDWLGCNVIGAFTNILTDFNPNVCDGKFLPAQVKSHPITPRAIINYQVDPDVFLYASATRGFRSGGFNNSELVGPGFGVKPESVWSYEAGIKSELFDRKLRANLAVFTSDYSDLQVRALDQVVKTFKLANAGSARIRGAELELLAKPAAGLELSTNVSYLDARYKTFASPTGDASGRRLSNTPKWQINSTISYEYQLPSGATLTPRGELTYVSTVYFDEQNIFPIAAHAHANINARLLYRPASGPWDLQLFVENLTNRRDPTLVLVGIAPGDTAALIPPPRIYGLRVSLDF